MQKDNNHEWIERCWLVLRIHIKNKLKESFLIHISAIKIIKKSSKLKLRPSFKSILKIIMVHKMG